MTSVSLSLVLSVSHDYIATLDEAVVMCVSPVQLTLALHNTPSVSTCFENTVGSIQNTALLLSIPCDQFSTLLVCWLCWAFLYLHVV